jgi:hypothetical protein
MKITVYPSDDAYVISAEPTWNLGSETNFAVEGNGSTQLAIAYFKFTDFTDMPANAIPQSATFKIYIYDNGTGAVNSAGLFKCNADWDEDTITWNSRPGSSGDALRWMDLSTTGLKSGDITDAFIDWYNGGTNYGMLLHTIKNGFSQGRTKEYSGTTNDPTIEVTFRYKESAFMIFLSEAFNKGNDYFKKKGLWLPESKPLTI